ncbi:SpoIIE family protein phosphatase [Flavobacterium psychrotrophum]|uniref:SpoIIE family protein phosphatase n=1 Tax=Flavobacterium psychrotrophum TaxID=2294119 RepID=UPI000E318D0A|nr:SpoIIE family protein phosphatase [Flavobacterium psychrotrophum]
MDNTFYSYRIEDKSYVSFVKREIHNLTVAAGFSSQKTGEIDIVVSELASNLVKFVGSGEILYRTATDTNGVFFEIYCLDKGQGIHNLPQMMRDGASTSQTLGQGLGAIERLSSESSIYTLKGWGTVAHSKIYKDAQNEIFRKEPVHVAAVQVNMPGESVCGDGYAVKYANNGVYFFLGDGLGHGEHAHDAVALAITAFKECREKSLVAILQYIHHEVKKTRGLVATIVFLDLKAQKWHLCGIGNIATSIYTGLESKNYTPYNGIVGLNIPRTLTESVFELNKYQTLVMHSDGLRGRWNLTGMPGLLKHSPNTIAGTLYKDHARGTDDMSVLVAKVNL